MLSLVTAALQLVKEWIVNYGNPESQKRRRIKRYAKKMDKNLKKIEDALESKDSEKMRRLIDDILDRRL